MTIPTPAHDFLSEVSEINGFIVDIISCPRKSDWHWPSFYLLYVDVDRLAMALMRTEYFFTPPMSDAFALATPDELIADASDILADVGKCQKAVFRWFYRMSQRITRDQENAALHARLDEHIHPKSGWHQIFLAEYDAGAVSADGNTLTRTVLPVLAAPLGDRIDHVTASTMLLYQEFDVSTPQARMELAQATKRAAHSLGQVAARMQACLLHHCRLEDLLYPCSS